MVRPSLNIDSKTRIAFGTKERVFSCRLGRLVHTDVVLRPAQKSKPSGMVDEEFMNRQYSAFSRSAAGTIVEARRAQAGSCRLSTIYELVLPPYPQRTDVVANVVACKVLVFSSNGDPQLRNELIQAHCTILAWKSLWLLTMVKSKGQRNGSTWKLASGWTHEVRAQMQMQNRMALGQRRGCFYRS